MKNKVDDFYGYNDLVSSAISRACLSAYDQYDKEISNGNTHRVAMARAIGDAIKGMTEIYVFQNSLDRNLISQGYHEKSDYIKYQQRAVFLRIADDIYNSGNYRIQQFNNNYESTFKYSVGIIKLGVYDAC